MSCQYLAAVRVGATCWAIVASVLQGLYQALHNAGTAIANAFIDVINRALRHIPIVGGHITPIHHLAAASGGGVGATSIAPAVVSSVLASE